MASRERGNGGVEHDGQNVQPKDKAKAENDGETEKETEPESDTEDGKQKKTAEAEQARKDAEAAAARTEAERQQKDAEDKVKAGEDKRVQVSINRSPSRLQFLRKVVPNSTHKVVIDELSNNPATDMVPIGGNGPQIAAELRLADTIADISNEDESITRGLLIDPEVKSLRDIALHYGDNDLVALAAGKQRSKPNAQLLAQSKAVKPEIAKDAGIIPPGIKSLQGRLFQKERSAFLLRMLREGQMDFEEAPAKSGQASAKAAQSSDTVRAGVITFFENNPQLNMQKTSAVTLLSAPQSLHGVDSKIKPKVQSAVKRLQLAQSLAPAPEAVPVLFKAGLSASTIAQFPEHNFVVSHAKALGGESVAKSIHGHATAVAVRNDHALTTILQTVRGSGISSIDGKETRPQRLARMKLAAQKLPEQINLEKLFGSLDFCACDDCNSVTSPASYFVELLQFLRNNNLDPSLPASSRLGFQGTPLEKLFRRRPDLACLELTCANTNTVLPYIDLANEVMESFIVHQTRFAASKLVPRQTTIDVFNSSATGEGQGGSSAELLAEPQNTNYTAYCTLTSAVYPAIKLPYNQPIDVARQILQFLGTSRYELDSIFKARYVPPTVTKDDTWSTEHSYCGGGSGQPGQDSSYSDPGSDVDADEQGSGAFKPTPLTPAQRESLVKIHTEALSRSDDAEFLLVTESEYIILTKEAFWPKAHFDIRHGTTNSPATYQERIGVRKYWEYWGSDYDSADAMLATDETKQTGLTFVKKQFLPRTGIVYQQLVDLLQTEYINPNMLKGRNKVIMETLRFSYVYLAKLIDQTQKHRSRRLLKLIEFLQNPTSNDEVLQGLLDADSGLAKCCYPTEERRFMEKASLVVATTDTTESKCTKKRCAKHQVERCYTCAQEELVRWVCDHFEAAGKIIVLDSGEPPRLPWEADIFSKAAPITIAVAHVPALRAPGATTGEDEGTVIGHLYPDGRITNSGTSTTLIARVMPSGLVQFLDGTPFMSTHGGEVITVKRTGANSDDDTGSIDSTSMLHFPNSDFPWSSVQDDCDITKVRLRHLDGTPLTLKEYDRIHRFLRLWRKLGWGMADVDAALRALGFEPPPVTAPPDPNDSPEQPTEEDIDWIDFRDACKSGKCDKETCIHCSSQDSEHVHHGVCRSGKCGRKTCLRCGAAISTQPSTSPTKKKVRPDIMPYFMHQLVYLMKFVNLSGLPLMKVLSFWTTIDTFGDNSFYAQLFLTHNMLGIDTVFQPDDNGNYLSKSPVEKIADHKPIILAALQLKPDDLNDIITVSKVSGDLKMENISAIYRYSIFAKLLGVKPKVLPDIFAALGSPWTSGESALNLLQLWNKISDAGFTFKQLNYIFRNVDDPLQPTGPSQRTILQITTALYNGLKDIDSQHPEITSADAATSAVLSANVQLLFDSNTATQIPPFLEGTKVYLTNAPQGLVITIPAELKNKLRYTDGDNSTVQTTGQLTTQETQTAKLLASSNKAWLSAIDRLSKQALKFFNDTLFGVFPDQVEAKTALISGDIAPPADAKAENYDTAPAKRLYFLKYFIPFLRQKLADKLIVDTVASMVSLPNSLTDILLRDILALGKDRAKNIPGTSCLQAFRDIKNDPESFVGGWDGYLVAPSSDKYSLAALSVVDDDQPAAIEIDGKPYTFSTQQEDPSNVWIGQPMVLTGGKLYLLSVKDQSATNLSWKTDRSPLSGIPSSALLPQHATTKATDSYTALLKAATIINGFSLTADEVVYLHSHTTDFENFDWSSIKLPQWKRLADYVTLRNSLPKLPTTLLNFFEWSNSTNAKNDDISAKIAEVTLWNATMVKALISKQNFNLDMPNAYRNEINLIKLQKAIKVVTSTAVDAGNLFQWAKPKIDFWTLHQIAEDIHRAARAKYSLSEWEQAIKPVYDTLRQNQSDALVAYLTVQPQLVAEGVIDADSLFEFFLIDVSMCPCMDTSRMKQATSSVQLFIQRCMLGLENQDNGFGRGVPVDILDRKRWDWMQRYRVWEANRKVFLYPENWIQSSLRDDKSPLYQQLESDLLQKDINQQTVLDAVKNYLYNLDEVANLEVDALYVEDEFPSGSGADTTAPKAKQKKIHVFGKTRQAPPRFYYRSYDIVRRSWTAWQLMQIDVPSYEVERSKTASDRNLNGSYLVPFMYNNRLFIGLPQFMKKQVPQLVPDKAVEDMAKQSTPPAASQNASALMPLEYWEIKMGFSELLNGKWKQKVISAEAVWQTPVPSPLLPEVSEYQFVPITPSPAAVGTSTDVLSNLYIDVIQGNSTQVGRFVFSGNLIARGDSAGFPAASASATTFQFKATTSDRTMTSLQVLGESSTSYEYSSSPKAVYPAGPSETSTIQIGSGSEEPFYHQFAHSLLNQVTSSSDVNALSNLFGYFLSIKDEKIVAQAFGDVAYPPSSGSEEKTYNELARPYSLYNWELGFHAPMALVDQLLQSQQFDLALQMCHHVFNPFATGTDEKRYWTWAPFRKIDSINNIEKLFSHLRAPGPARDQINQWRDNPFQPHLLARLRPVAYMKWVVMKYIQILIAYGDYFFRQNTLEMIPMALQCYVLASHVYGPRGQKIPKRGKKKAETYLSLMDKFDEFDNAMVQLELQFPFSNQIEEPYWENNGVIGLANVFGFATGRYFCIPDNPQLTALRDTIDDRLFKIRHCQDITGVVRQLPLYEPSIDPGLLVAATAQGLSLSSVLNDLNTPLPNYRFSFLLAKALELCSELKSLGAGFVSAKEKQDAEALSVLRQSHETVLQNLIMEQKKLSLDEATKNVESLEYSRKKPVNQMQHALKLLGADMSALPDPTLDFTEMGDDIEAPVDDSGLKITSGEKLEFDKSNDATTLSVASGVVQTIASTLHVLPTINAHASPFGVGVAACWGPPNIAEAMNAVSAVMRIASEVLNHESASAARRNAIIRTTQDRVQTANSAGYDIKNIDKQLVTQRIRIEMCNHDITVQQKQIDNAQEVRDFLVNKYTNKELYVYFETEIRTLYYQTYQMAYDWAKKAEKVFRFERGLDDSNFIKFGYWDATHDGLFSGENLFMGLKSLEAAYHESRGYDFEVGKFVSLRQTNPIALLALRDTGTCDFAVPEVLFDMDFPGQYLRKLKTVALTIPCVVGPYTSINCTLRLLSHKYRNTALAKDKQDYVEKVDQGTDSRFSTVNIPINSIAVCSGQNDSGMFEVNFKDERFMPFEGAGAISQWRLELPAAFRQFDYSTISDVVMHMRYTSVDGGDKLKQVSSGAVVDYIAKITDISDKDGLFALFDIRNEYSLEYQQFLYPGAGATARTLVLNNLNERLPIYTKGSPPSKLVAKDIWIVTDAQVQASDFALKQAPSVELSFGDSKIVPSKTFKVFAAQGPCNIGSWTVSLKNTTSDMTAFWIMTRYSMKQ